MPGHYFNLSKHPLEEHVNLLTVIEKLIKDVLGIKDVKVFIPMTEDWDGFVYIPDMKPSDFMIAITKYGLIPDSVAAGVAEGLGFSGPAFEKVPIASRWKNDYMVTLEQARAMIRKEKEG